MATRKKRNAPSHRDVPFTRHGSPCYKVSMSTLFDKVALIGRHDDARVAESLRSLASHLANRRREIVVDTPADFKFPVKVNRVAESQFQGQAELVVAVGGDGTMLHAARIA